MDKKKIEMKIEIKKVTTGEIKELIWDDFVFHRFWWEEGNASCDCNRGDWFGDDNDPDICTTGKYRVKISNNKTGEVLYNEWK